MRTIAHLGSATAQQGGPGGYLAQLRRALERFGPGESHVLLPPAAPPPAPAPPGSSRLVLPHLRRLRRQWGGAPEYYRPAAAALRREGGPVHEMMSAAWAEMRENSRRSLEDALNARADVLFAHEAPAAESALDARRAGQEVWLFLHTPTSLALYLAWAFGVPEASWEDVAALPDVRAWTAKELEVIARVDRVLAPSAEAVAEIVRSDARFASVLGSVDLLMTGGGGPARVWPSEDRNALRRRWGLPTGVPVALYLGSAQPYRGFDVLTSAVPLLPSRRELPGIIAVAGPALEAVPISPRLRALGRVHEVSDLLASVDFVINVNRFSLFDLSMVEAVEAGCVLVMHPTGGNATFRRLGAGVIPIHDLRPCSVAAALCEAFAMSGASREELGRQSRACYEAHLTPQHLRDRHVARYAHVSR